MKTYSALQQKYSSREIAESYIFSGSQKPEAIQARLKSFRQYRKNAAGRMTVEDKLKANLLQLKFQIEDYLAANAFSRSKHFSFFLKEYITRLEKKNKDFAVEIDIDPTELSQVINRHRSPSEKLIIRLEIHSNKNFPALLWFKLIQKEKAFELDNNEKLRARERKHVKEKLRFSLS